MREYKLLFMTKLEHWVSRSWNLLSDFDRIAVKLFKELKCYWDGVDRQIHSYTKKLLHKWDAKIGLK